MPKGERSPLSAALIKARRAVGVARTHGAVEGLKAAGAAVDEAKIGLGKRGPVWWEDGAPDLNRLMARTTPYADWYRTIEAGETSVYTRRG